MNGSTRELKPARNGELANLNKMGAGHENSGIQPAGNNQPSRHWGTEISEM